MLVRGVVHHHVEQDAHASPVDLLDQLQGVFQRAKFGGDGPVIRNVVAKIPLRRLEERGAPDGFEAEIPDVIELLDEPLNIANAIPVGVTERARIDLIDGSSVVPGQVGHADLSLWASRAGTFFPLPAGTECFMMVRLTRREI